MNSGLKVEDLLEALNFSVHTGVGVGGLVEFIVAHAPVWQTQAQR